MLKRRRIMRRRGALNVLAITGLLAAAGAALALDAVPWEQERVVEAATRFELSVNELYESARLAKFEPMTRKNAIFLIVQDLKTLKRYSTRLVGQLREGEGQAETAPLFDRIGMIVRDIRAKKDMAPILENSQAALDKARERLLQLAAFYGKQPLP
jgi:hypothetical protein